MFIYVCVCVRALVYIYLYAVHEREKDYKEDGRAAGRRGKQVPLGGDSMMCALLPAAAAAVGRGVAHAYPP